MAILYWVTRPAYQIHN